MSLKELIIGACFSVLLGGLGACAPGLASNPPSTLTPGVAAASATPTQQAAVDLAEPTHTPAPSGAADYYLKAGCNLLNSHDVGLLFTTAEVARSSYQPSRVNHLAFSSETVSATESTCVYYAYRKPGSKDMQMLQATYWVDTPDQATSGEWASVWADARSRAARVIPGVGDDAFFDGGRLTFRKGDTYITIEVVGMTLDTRTDPGLSRQLDMETTLALKALTRLG